MNIKSFFTDKKNIVIIVLVIILGVGAFNFVGGRSNNASTANESSNTETAETSESSESSDSSESTETTTYSGIIRVKLQSNIAVAKYDVLVYVDGKNLTNLSDDESKSGNVELSEGEHTIKVVSQNDNSLYATKTFSVENDDFEYTFSFKRHIEYIEISIE